MITPPPLQRGDVIGIIAPAGQITDQQRFERGIAILTEMGFEPRFPREMWPGTGYLADADTKRGRELHEMFADSEIKGVMAARGGYGCLRTLGHLNFPLLRQEPKAFVGFSDITLLLNQAAFQANLLSFHGPVVTSLCDSTNESLARLYHCLTGNWQRSIIPPKLEVLRGEHEVEGRLVGGNLCSIITLLGTPYDFDWKNCIVLLEDVGEPLYRIDRMLTQLALAGKLSQAAGIILGDFTLSNDQGALEKMRYTEYVWQRILELTTGCGISVWGNFPSGHCPENLTVPIGAHGVMDSARGELRFS
jgi:muramoyltetrapeptide carboxypeptidase